MDELLDARYHQSPWSESESENTIYQMLIHQNETISILMISCNISPVASKVPVCVLVW